MRKFGINLRGRIKNFNLPKNQPLIPLFEAIVNSIHAIDERKKLGDRTRAMPASTSQRRTKPKVRRNSDVIKSDKVFS